MRRADYLTAGILLGGTLYSIDDWFVRVMVALLVVFALVALGVAWDVTERDDG